MFLTSLLGRGQCGTDVAREGALQLVKAMEALNPTQEPAKQQGEALIQGDATMPPDATRCHKMPLAMSCVDYWRLRRLRSCGVEEYFLSLKHDFAGVGCPYDLLICCRC